MSKLASLANLTADAFQDFLNSDEFRRYGDVSTPQRKRKDITVTSSGKNNWSTPQWLYDQLNIEFGFTIDLAAQSHNAKHERYYTMKQDALAYDWSKEIGWLNPPYGRKIGKWMNKARSAALMGGTIVALPPAKLGTRWWYNFCREAEVRIIVGRLSFDRLEEGVDENGDKAPFDTAIVIFRPGLPKQYTKVEWVDIIPKKRQQKAA